VSTAQQTALDLKLDDSQLDTDAALAANSASKIPAQSAVKSYADARETAAKAYADALVVGLVDDRGNYDASGHVFPSSGGSGTAGAILKGDLWFVSVGGTLGGVAVAIGGQVRALVNTPGQTAGNWGISEANVGFVPENVANKDTDTALAADSDTKYASQKATKAYADLKAAKAANLSDVANAATAFSNIKQAASDSATGVVELATDAETETGTDTARATTPANVASAYVKKSLLTTRGDLIRRGASAPERVALGAANTQLVSDGTDAIWRTLTAQIDAALGSTRGAILRRGATGWEILAPGTSGHFLKSFGAGADTDYAAIPGGGDMLAANNLSDLANATTARGNLGIHDAQKASFSANKGGTNQTLLTSGAFAKITFTTEEDDAGSCYDATNSKCIPPVGKFEMRARGYVADQPVDANSLFAISIYKNGSEFKTKYMGHPTAFFGSIDINIEVVGNNSDYYEVYMRADIAAAANWAVSGNAFYTEFVGHAI
jgi:hypothetical protein